MNPKSLFYFSALLAVASLLGNSILCDDTLIFEPNTVKTWDPGFLFRESVIVLSAKDKTQNMTLHDSWRSLMVYMMDDAQYQSYLESKSFDSFKPLGSNLEGLSSYTYSDVWFRVPHESNWHVVIINTKPASQPDLEKTYMINLGVEYKAGFLRYPGILGMLIAGILYYRKRSEAAKRQSVTGEDLVDTTR